jgi:type I restriction enzyme S subunit
VIAWPVVPLKHLADINRRVLPENTPPETEFRYIDISTCGRGRLESEPEAMRLMDAPSRARRLVRPGDTLISTVRTYLRAVWPVAGPSDDLVASTGFAVLSPRGRLDPRFLGWVAQSDPFIEEIVARSVGVSYPAINGLEVGDLRVAVPDLATQRAIADYLDAATARIDAIASRRMFMIRLFQEWEQARLVGLLGDWRAIPTATLRQLRTTVITGPFGTQLAASEYTRGGVPLINPTHISDGRLTPDPEVAVLRDVARRLIRHRLDVGDIVMGRKGDVGRAAVVGPTEAGWICGSDSIAIRTAGERLLPEFLAVALRSDYYRQQLEAQSTGAMVASVSESILLAFRVPNVPIDEQKRIVEAGREAHRSRALIVDLLRGQAERMEEWRQALITAAVTGQLPIPGLAA